MRIATIECLSERAECRGRRSVLFSLVICCTLVAPSLAQESTGPRTGSGGTSLDTPDNVCGARCLQYLLRQYQGTEQPLEAIVRHVQWPDVGAGAALADMQTYLESRGIRTKPLRIAGGQIVLSRFPYVVHLEPSRPAGIGHFAIVLPGSDRSRAMVWDMDGAKELQTWELAERMSGVILLTGPAGSDLSGPDVRAVLTTDALMRRWGYLLLGILVLATVGFARTIRRHLSQLGAKELER